MSFGLGEATGWTCKGQRKREARLGWTLLQAFPAISQTTHLPHPTPHLPHPNRGELIKEAESFFALGGWNERWVVLDKREFKYYKYKGDKEPAHVIRDVRKMKLVKKGACEKKFPAGTEAGTCFEVQDHSVSPVKSMFFFAMGKLELTKWTAAIENNIQLYEIGYGNAKMMKAATKTKPELKIKDLIDFPKVNEKIATHSAKELKKRLKEYKIDLSGCLDKHDFVEKAKLCVPIVIEASLEFMSLKQMKDLLQEASEASEGEVSAAGCELAGVGWVCVRRWWWWGEGGLNEAPWFAPRLRAASCVTKLACRETLLHWLTQLTRHATTTGLERSDFVRKLKEDCVLRM